MNDFMIGDNLRDIIIGVIGSLIGAAFVFFASRGWKFTSDLREKAKLELMQEKSEWNNGGQIGQQRITNKYLFEILKFILFGSLFSSIPLIISAFSIMDGMITSTSPVIFYVLSGFASLASFYWGLGKVIRYRNLSS